MVGPTHAADVGSPVGSAPRQGRPARQAASRHMAARDAKRRPSRVPVTRRPSEQPILIAPVDDASEHDADRVALGAAHPSIMRAAPSALSSAVTAPPSVRAAVASPGRPLEGRARKYFEPRFGNLNGVRIHDGPAATASASDVSARAYTVGADIVFADGAYRHDDPVARTLLAHELAHVAQPAAQTPVLRRFPDCRRLLSDGTGRPRRGRPVVPESAVQAFLFDRLEQLGEAEREFPVPAGSAAPLRTDGRPGDDTVIDPQVISEEGKGKVDIALHMGFPELEFLEVKEATWAGAAFAEQQVLNYVVRGNEALDDVARLWRGRRHRLPRLTSVVEMPTSRYPLGEAAEVIDGEQVMLAWCRPGVIVFKTLDPDNRDVLYCGISDKGQTDAFIGRLLDQAEGAVVRALTRRLNELGLGPVNVKLLLDKVRDRLQASIRYLLEDSLKTVCAAALEVSLAALLDAFRRRLFNIDLVDVLIAKLSPRGDGIPLPLGEAAARTAAVLSIGVILEEIGALILAL